MKFLSRPTRLILAGSLVLALVLASPGPRAQAKDSPQVTISVTSHFKRETGFVYVLFRQGRAATATISGTAIGAPSGSSVALLDLPFPFNTPVQTLKTAPLRPSAGVATYSFTVAPNRATRYAVELETGGAVHQGLARSSVATLYVAAGLVYSPRQFPACGRPECHQSFQVTATYPLAAAAVESTKPWATYLNYSLSPTQVPPPPIWLTFTPGWKVSPPRQIRPGVYVTTFALSFKIGNNGYAWRTAVCTRDSEGRDGIGLPGTHRCGAYRILTSRFATGYVG